MRTVNGLVASVLLATLLAAPAHATTSRLNGQITYDDEHTVFVINPDGTGFRRLTPDGDEGCCATWSPDGSKLAMAGGTDDGRIGTAIANADGSGYHVLPIPVPGLNLVCNIWSPKVARLACQGWNDDDPTMDGIYTARTDGTDVQHVATGLAAPLSYSPDGARILYEYVQYPDAWRFISSLVTVKTDGTDPVDLGPRQRFSCCNAGWSPDGQWIIYAARGRLWVVHPDGTAAHQIRLQVDDSRYWAFEPGWSPDGSHIVFAMGLAGRESDIYTAAPDGSDLVQVTDTPGHEGIPSWGTHPPQP